MYQQCIDMIYFYEDIRYLLDTGVNRGADSYD